jgi:hypothetical protein
MDKEILDELIADRIVEIMNEALKLDSRAITELVEMRIPCDVALANHPSIQIQAGNRGNPAIGLLGILNGLAGTQVYKGVPGWGRVEAVFEDDGSIITFRRVKDWQAK